MTKEPLILFLEDDEGEARGHASRLARRGFATTVVSKAEDVLGALLGPTPPSAIVVERENHDWQLTRLLRANPRTYRVPIVALVTERAAALVTSETGCDRILPKPCSPAELLVAIETLLVPTSRQTAPPRALSPGLRAPARPSNAGTTPVDGGHRVDESSSGAPSAEDGPSVRLMHLRIALYSAVTSLEATSQVNAAPAGSSDFRPEWHEIAKKAATRLRAAREFADDLSAGSERDQESLRAMRAALARAVDAFESFECAPEDGTRSAAVALGRVVAEIKAESDAWE